MFFAAQRREREPGRNLCSGHAKSSVKRSSFCAGPWKIRPHGRGSHVNEGSGCVPASLPVLSYLPVPILRQALWDWDPELDSR